MDKRCQDALGHAKRELKALNQKLEQQNNLIQRLVKQNAELQYDNRELRRVHDQAFKLLGSTMTKVNP